VAVKKIPVPFCDWCGVPFLPKFRLKDGTLNPIFDHPEKSKRCGKCKRTGWNAGGIDRRRKPVIEEIPKVTTQDVIATVCGLEENVKPETLKSLGAVAVAAVERPRRCKHGLFTCQKCHGEQTA
jgi:hypothetical protein